MEASSDNPVVVSMTNLGIQYLSSGKQTTALSGLTLDVSRAEIVAFVGPSGCGKTSLLRAIAGIVKPSKGELTIDGLPPRQYRSSRGIGVCFQSPVLLEWRTVLQNALLPADLRGRPDDATIAYAKEMLSLVGLTAFEDALPAHLSGGMKQRVNLVRALLLRPHICLLDEPISGLDEIARESMWTTEHRLWRQLKQTVVLATHSSREACFLADRVVILTSRPGRIKGIIKIDLPPVRDKAVLAMPYFHKLCDDIRALLV